uniref:NADH-ubiquinone oxidoreductase chain 5 n=1 Tax=Thremma gallicum TaxID=1586284 RepID=A0A0U1ZB93_9NEOP|nr:NADH dehydrogenase subunit 5 [Thremma gallicum]
MNFSLFIASSFILLLMSLSFLFLGSLLLFKGTVIFLELHLLNYNSLDLVMIFLLDWMSNLFMGVVCLISSMVVFYSNSYMSKDVNKNRFLILVILFVLSMMLMIVSPNMISILLGWDGLGLISYLLVTYYQNEKSFNAGMLTIMSNRIGDAAILMCIAWMLNFGSWNFYFYLNYVKYDDFGGLMIMLVILAGMTKSAQIPFCSWLPAAMAAPTPVSALVHSSTLVTAGVYLLIRFQPLFMGTSASICLMFIGMITMFISGLGANFEFDLKKIIALSTLSQLGLMMMILGAGFEILAFFHLLSHAFFKSLLFLCAGILIHSFKDIQDIRMMGNIIKFMPLTSTFFNVSNLALCGLPFLTGFYSKDLILEMVFLTNLNMISLFLCFVSTGFTVCYSVRVMYWSFFSEVNMTSLINIHDEDWIMSKSMLTLFFMSIFGGSSLMWAMMPTNEMVYLPYYLKILVLYLILGGIIIGILINYLYMWIKFSSKFELINFMGSIWFMPFISTYGMNSLFLNLGLNVKKNLDYGWSENLLVYNIQNSLNYLISYFQLMHKNFIKIYLLIFVMWIMCLIFMMNM